MDTQQLLDVLTYKRDFLEQFLTVASIFGGFAITGVVALRAESHHDRTHSLAFGAMSSAAIAFIYATAFDSIWLPVSHLQRLRTPPAIEAVLSSGDSIVWATLVGAVSLLAAVGLLGFIRSRRTGIIVLVLALGAAIVFFWNARKLFAAV